MNTKRPLPLSIVAWLFIIAGVFSVWDLASQLWYGWFSLNTGVLFIFLGRGLLRLRPAAHTWALVVVVLGWVLLAVVIIACGIFDSGVVRFGDTVVTGWQRQLTLLGIVTIYGALLAWVTRILLRDEIEDMFRRGAA
jgi:hypothetical protein